jgi:3-phenylpropionate/cinnamic acid dioxygenase small subunit
LTVTVDNAEELDRLLEAVGRPERLATTPEQRLAALEDRDAVRDLIVRYGLLCDARRWDALLDLYTDDFERELAGTLREFAQGKDRLRQLYERPELPRTDGSSAAPPPVAVLSTQAVRHLITDPGIRLVAEDGAVAVARYALVAEREDDAGYVRGTHEGSYIFTFRKNDGRWRFSRMVVFSNNARNPLFNT